MWHHDYIKDLNSKLESSALFSPQKSFNRNFELKEVKEAVNKTKNGKAPGLDWLTYEVLKNKTALEALVKLFNYCLVNNCIPTTWSKGMINPIPKNASSDPRVPLNYRGISLLPVVSKLYTGLIANIISVYMEANNLLANEQNGFRSDRSCLDHIFTMCDLLRIRKAQNLATFCSFMDFQKAFDYVNRDYFLHKLLQLGIDGSLYESILK